MILGLRSIAAVILVLAPLAAPAHATPFQATLSFSIESAIGSLGAVSFVGSGSGTSTTANVTAPSGIFAGTALLPVAGVASLSAVSIAVSGNGAGQFLGKYPFLRGSLPFSGALRLKGSLGAGPTTLANVPLGFTTHSFLSGAPPRGLGRGGYFPSASLDADFYTWRIRQAYVPAAWGKYQYTTHIPVGMAASRRSYFNYTYIVGSDARTPGGLGQVTLVSPIRIETNLPGTGSLLVVFGTLTLNFVPEPGTLLLCGFGIAALAALGARSRRRL